MHRFPVHALRAVQAHTHVARISRARTYATFSQRPLPETESFTGPAKPGELHARPQATRDLPEIGKSYPAYIGVAALAVSVWAGFILYSTNQERLSSSVVRQVLTKLRDGSDPRLAEALGDGIVPETAWYALGDPYINGAINLLQGHVDVSFRVRGSRGSGIVYFTSIRKAKGQHFSILRFKVICDDGTLIEDIHDAAGVR